MTTAPTIIARAALSVDERQLLTLLAFVFSQDGVALVAIPCGLRMYGAQVDDALWLTTSYKLVPV